MLSKPNQALGLSLALGLLLWSLLAMLYPRFILPSPLEVWNRALSISWSAMLSDVWATLWPTLLGFGLATVAAGGLGYLAFRVGWFQRLVWPWVVVMQSIPVVAVLPLLVIWFGAGVVSELAVIGVIAFFPIYVAVLKGFGEVDPAHRLLMRSWAASPMMVFRAVEWPSALPAIMVGLKVGMVFAFVGTVVYELTLGKAGVGYLVAAARARLDTPLVFVALILLAVIGLALQAVLRQAERWVLARRSFF